MRTSANITEIEVYLDTSSCDFGYAERFTYSDGYQESGSIELHPDADLADAVVAAAHEAGISIDIDSVACSDADGGYAIWTR